MSVLDIDLLKWVVDEALKMGADEAECFASSTKGFDIQIMAGEVRQPTYINEKGLGIRVVKDKKIGFASTNIFTKDAIRDTIKKALSIANASKANPKWVQLPEERKYPRVEKIYDKRIDEISAEKAIDYANILVGSATKACLLYTSPSPRDRG